MSEKCRVWLTPELTEWVDELRKDERSVYFGMSRTYVAQGLLGESKALLDYLSEGTVELRVLDTPKTQEDDIKIK